MRSKRASWVSMGQFPVALSLPLDVLDHEDHDGETVEHEHEEDVEVGVSVVFVLLHNKPYHT